MKTALIVCGALRREVKKIASQNGWDVEIYSVSPDDHLFPERIAPDVEERIVKLRGRYEHMAVVFGECGSRGKLDEVLARYNLSRIDTQNCYEMYAGELYHEMLEEERGTFFLTDFLTATFRHAVMEGLGLDRYPELKQDYFHNCTRIVYLIQNENPRLRTEAQAIADFMGLPLKFYRTGYEGLEKQLKVLLNREKHHERSPSSNKTASSGKNDITGDLLMLC
ncbi:MAG: DUF1638 domain-containing protein [Dehalococcoidia bacterium]